MLSWIALMAGAWAAGPLPGLEDSSAQGFAQVLGPMELAFPRDHGAHPDYRQEWWYVTGNLDSDTGERFGFELTFFRFGLRAGAVGESAWRTRQIYMAHFAVTDVGRGRFRAAQKLSRGAVGLAGARNPPLRVWVDDWVLGEASASRVGGTSVDAPGREHWMLHASQDGYELTLDMRALLAPVLNGERGFSQKSDTPGVASYYYSIPRVAVQGELARDGKIVPVHGLAWVDREWGSGSLDTGWDWFALQFGDGSALMFYSLRDRQGRRDIHSAGTWINAAGESRPLARDDVQVEVLDYWQSPRGGRYPAKWHVRVPSAGVDVEVRPVLADQELVGPPRYWEGAVDVVPAGGQGMAAAAGGAAARTAMGTSTQRSAGRGYVELVGYAAQ